MFVGWIDLDHTTSEFESNESRDDIAVSTLTFPPFQIACALDACIIQIFINEPLCTAMPQAAAKLVTAQDATIPVQSRGLTAVTSRMAFPSQGAQAHLCLGMGKRKCHSCGLIYVYARCRAHEPNL